MSTACFATTLALFVFNLANNLLKREDVVLAGLQRSLTGEYTVAGSLSHLRQSRYPNARPLTAESWVDTT